MIYYTGDIHGEKIWIVHFSKRMNLTDEDVVVILGDVGANYYETERDHEVKRAFSKLKPTIFCIHGNHEIRPANIPTYKTKEWNGGLVWYEEQYPNILFAKDGEIYNLDGMDHLVIGGAYSVDKHYRIMRHYGWWPDEQPSEEIKAYVEQQLAGKHIDVILSHTCPFKYEPRETFLPTIDQSKSLSPRRMLVNYSQKMLANPKSNCWYPFRILLHSILTSVIFWTLSKTPRIAEPI